MTAIFGLRRPQAGLSLLQQSESDDVCRCLLRVLFCTETDRPQTHHPAEEAPGSLVVRECRVMLPFTIFGASYGNHVLSLIAPSSLLLLGRPLSFIRLRPVRLARLLLPRRSPVSLPRLPPSCRGAVTRFSTNQSVPGVSNCL